MRKITLPMQLAIKKKAKLQLSVRLDAEGKVVSVCINTPAKAVKTVTRDLSLRTLGAVAGTMLSLSGGAAKGAIARNKNMTPERRREIAIKANAARWGNKQKAKK